MANPLTRPVATHQTTLHLPYDHAAMSATTTVKIGGVGLRAFVATYVWYDNPTGFAQDPSAYWTIALKSGTTTLATWSTQTGTQGTLTADTPVTVPLSTTPGGSAGETLSLVFTKTGAPANLPAGRIHLQGNVL